jgi:hypothetical protein
VVVSFGQCRPGELRVTLMARVCGFLAASCRGSLSLAGLVVHCLWRPTDPELGPLGPIWIWAVGLGTMTAGMAEIWWRAYSSAAAGL